MDSKRVVIVSDYPFVAVEVGVECRPGDELSLPRHIADALIAAGLAKEPAQTEEPSDDQAALVDKPKRRR
jgi:hypothetical protein